MTTTLVRKRALTGLSLSTLTGLLLMRQMEDRRVKQIWRSLEAGATSEGVFSEEMVAGLPEPAQRYLMHAIKPGTPLASSVYLTFKGSVQFGPQSKHNPSQGSEILIVPKRGFVWKESCWTGPVISNGALYYASGQGRVRWRFFNLIPNMLKSGKSPNTWKAMKGRFFTKYVWTPFALLPQQGAVWEAVDEEHAKVTVTVDGTATTLTLHIDPEGRLRESVSMRWGAKSKDGSYNYFPYGVTVTEEKTFGGYTIPSRMSATWCYGDTDREPPLIFNYNIEQARFV